MKNTTRFETPKGLLDFLYAVKPKHTLSTKVLVRRLRKKHRVLCRRYDMFLKQESLHSYLVYLLRDYERLLFYVNELIFLNRDPNLKSSLRPISNVLEETALSIWSNEIVQIERARLLCKEQEAYYLEKYGDDTNYDDEDWEEED